MRRKVRDLLNPEAPKNGEIGRGRDSFDNIKANKGGTSESYTVRRLKRDRPEHTKAPPTIGRWGWAPRGRWYR